MLSLSDTMTTATATSPSLLLPPASISTTTPTTRSTPPPPPPPPQNITIEPITASTLPSYRRLVTSLLPIRYQDKYYAESIADPTSTSLALCAVYHDPHLTPEEKGGEVIAGIQCRLEPITQSPALSPSTTTPTKIQNPTTNHHHNHPPLSPPLSPHHRSPDRTLYISTLCTLSPQRHRGIATALLNTIQHTLLTHPAYTPYTITSLYAHVWEANTEALEWYERRGFEVEKGVVEGYYRRLRPMGARVVRREVGVTEYVKANARKKVGNMLDKVETEEEKKQK